MLIASCPPPPEYSARMKAATAERDAHRAAMDAWATPEEEIRDGWTRFRVPGGWLYRNKTIAAGSTPVFVPFVNCKEHSKEHRP